MAALRFRFAPPAVTHGAGGNLALTINADHSVGAGQVLPAHGTRASSRKSTSFDHILGGLTSALNGVSNFVGGKTGSMIGAGIGLAIAGPIGAAIGFLGAKLLGGLGKVLGSVVNALFGTKTSITGQGIYGGAQSLGSILSGGFDASYYTDIKKTKKFFGISVGSSYSTQYAAASAELEQQFRLIFSGFYDAISAAAGPLGMSLDEVRSRLAGFVVNIGKIDLKGLTGEQIQEKLTAVFGAAADSIARAAIPGLEQFRQVGEGYFETLVRVASSIEAVTSSLSLLGTSVEGLSLSAKMNLFDLFGSASDMASATSDYFSLFYTKAEQTAALTAQMNQVFGSLGLTLPDSIAGFRALVDAQDLTTEAGRTKTYAQALSEFNAATLAARSGDQKAAKSLPGLSQMRSR